MDSLNVKNINDEKIFNVIDPNGQGEVVNRIRPISVSIAQKVETINDETVSNVTLSVYWNDTWKSILELSFDDSLRQEYGKLVEDLTAIQKDIDMKQYKDAETKTNDFLKYVGNLSSKYTNIPTTQNVAASKNDFVSITANKNSFNAKISDKLLNFMLGKFEKVASMDYTKANECFSVKGNDIDIFFHSPELFKTQAYITVVKDKKVVGSYKATYDQFSKLASKLTLTPQQLGYTKDKMAGYMKTAEVVMQNIFFDSVDEAKEWQEMVDEKKKEEAEPAQEGQEESIEETTTTTTTEEKGETESPVKGDGGLARPSEDFASDEIPESEPKQQEQQGGQGIGASRRLNLLKKRAKKEYVVIDEWQEKNSQGVLETKKMEEELTEKELIDFAKDRWDADYDEEEITDVDSAMKFLEDNGFKVSKNAGKKVVLKKKANFPKYKVETLKQETPKFEKGNIVETPKGKGEIVDVVKAKLSSTPYYKIKLENGKQVEILEEELTKIALNKKAEGKKTYNVIVKFDGKEEEYQFKNDNEILALEEALGYFGEKWHELPMAKDIEKLDEVKVQELDEKGNLVGKEFTKEYFVKNKDKFPKYASVSKKAEFKDITVSTGNVYTIFNSYTKANGENVCVIQPKTINGKPSTAPTFKLECKPEEVKEVIEKWKDPGYMYEKSSKENNLQKQAIEGDVQEQDIVPAKTETKVYLQSEKAEDFAWLLNGSGRIEILAPKDLILGATGTGDNSNGVNELRDYIKKDLEKISVEEMQKTVSGYGIDNVKEMDRDELERYLVWLLAGDTADDLENRLADEEEIKNIKAKTTNKMKKSATDYKGEVAELLDEINEPDVLVDYISEDDAKKICKELNIPHEAEWYKGDLRGYIDEIPDGMVDVLIEYISESDAEQIWRQIQHDSGKDASKKTNVKKNSSDKWLEKDTEEYMKKDIEGTKAYLEKYLKEKPELFKSQYGVETIEEAIELLKEKNPSWYKKAEEETVEEKMEKQVGEDGDVKGVIGVGDIVCIKFDNLSEGDFAKYSEFLGVPMLLIENDKEDISKVIIEQVEYPFQRVTINKDNIGLFDNVKDEQVIVEDVDGDEMITNFVELPVVAKQCKIKSIHKAAKLGGK